MCKQIGAGMEYLAAMQVPCPSWSCLHKLPCHNQVVCRVQWNCFWSDTVHVDNSRSGMSHELYQKNCYRVEGQAILPICMLDGSWSMKKSYVATASSQVVMWRAWEVLFFAMQLYFGLSNNEVTKHIRMRKHLSKPIDCPSMMYSSAGNWLQIIDCFFIPCRTRFTTSTYLLSEWSNEA